MSLISCSGCGTVINKNKLTFPSTMYKEDGEIDYSKAFWDGFNHVPYIKCKVCGGPILQTQKD